MDSLIVTLKKKKHHTGPVVLGEVEKLQGTFQELKTAIIEDLQNYPKDPKDKAKDLVDGICDIAKKTSDVLKNLRQDLATGHPKEVGCRARLRCLLAKSSSSQL